MPEERRIVTVLFSDVSGSTELGEQLDPEDVRLLLRRYYAIASDVVAEYGGTLEKFIGDAVMAVFGFPRAHGDDARRAIASALDLHARVRDDSLLSNRLRVRSGLNTGEVVANRDGSANDFLVTGDAVNVAARLQQLAEPWQILCGERTWRAAANGFVFEPLPDVDLKGKRLPVRAFVALGRSASASRPTVPLVGRDADLEQLEFIARRVCTERRPFLVTLIAPAGMGKSRLIEEFLGRLPGWAGQVAVATAQCLPYGQRLTYWPLRSVLFRFLGIDGDADAETVRAAVRSWLPASEVGSVDRVASLLTATIGIGDVESSDSSELFAAWRTAIEYAARRSPLVLVLEDLHWSSDSLLDLYENVVQPRRDVPVLMIALARPELLDRRPHWGAGRRNYLAMSLEPLGDRDIATLVAGLMDAATPSVVERIVARAEGNPFYAGELIRSLVERVRSPDDPTEVERALATLPDTVQATVLARLDLLSAGERRILQLGSVYGRSFRAPGVAALDLDNTSAADELAESLVAKDLICPVGADGYTIRHILFQEIAYQTLPRAERARLHAAAARWLENSSSNHDHVLAELIAYHYREAAVLYAALTTVDDAFDDVRRKAVHWLTCAAEMASSAAATREGTRHLRAAIELADRDALPELFERLGDCIANGNEAVDAYWRALDRYREMGRPPDQQLRVIASLLTIYTRFQGSLGQRPSPEVLIGLRDEGRQLVDLVTDERVRTRFLIAEGFLPYLHAPSEPGPRVTPEEVAAAQSAIDQALSIARRIGDVRLHSAALDALAGSAQVRGAWEEARAISRQRLEFADRLDLYELGDAYAMIAWSCVVLGDLVEADLATTMGLERFQSGQALGVALHLLAWRILTRVLRGQWNDAVADSDRAHQIWCDMDRPASSFALRGFIAALDVARARRDERRIEQYRDVFETMLRSGLPRSSHWGSVLQYAAGDLTALEAEEIQACASSHRKVTYSERVLSLCCDRDHPPNPETLSLVAGYASNYRCTLLEAQALRALGLANRDPEVLTRSLALMERTVAVPYAARVRCERAALIHDADELARGRQVLADLGDLDQLSRFDRSFPS